ncbi:lasso peptide biosynthesis B2 protein [Pantoea vagans]|uniref:lasso peptide biosynthesis B2 protein n=1 Tax=Pantoea vagans TaxID=470934 RepID=UPI003209B7B5
MYIDYLKYRYAVYNNDVVILDIYNDKFSFIEDAVTEYSSFQLDHDAAVLLKSQFNLTTQSFVSGLNNDDYFDVRWIKPESTNKNPRHSQKALTLLFLYKLISCINKEGFKYIIRGKNRLEISRRMNCNIDDAIDSTFTKINSVFNYFDLKNPCLVYSYAASLLLAKQGYDSKVVVGVRTRPFISHAWLEVDGLVVGDDKDLRDKLSVILEV